MFKIGDKIEVISGQYIDIYGIIVGPDKLDIKQEDNPDGCMIVVKLDNIGNRSILSTRLNKIGGLRSGHHLTDIFR